MWRTCAQAEYPSIRKLSLILAAFTFAVTAFAADSVQRFQAFAAPAVLSIQNQTTLSGWQVYGGYNISRHFTLVADIGRYYDDSAFRPFSGAPILGTSHTRITSYSIGPHVVFRPTTRIHFFVHPAIGLAHNRVDVNSIALKLSETRPFLGIGGGFDLGISKFLAFRTSLDYAHTQFFAGKQNSFRTAFGPLFYFGGARSKH